MGGRFAASVGSKKSKKKGKVGWRMECEKGRGRRGGNEGRENDKRKKVPPLFIFQFNHGW